MAVIKNGNGATTMLHEAVVLDLGDLRMQAQAIIAQARAEADRIRAAAKEEVREIVRTAVDRGHAEGLRKGLSEGTAGGRDEGRTQALAEHRDALAGITSAFTKLLADREEMRALLLQDTRQEVLAFAIALAEKIVRRRIESDPATVLEEVGAALALVTRSARLAISIHPEDRAIVEQALPSLVAQHHAGEVRLIERPDLARGGCVLSTAAGQIDASIECQLRRIAEMLLGAQCQAESAPQESSDAQNLALGEAA